MDDSETERALVRRPADGRWRRSLAIALALAAAAWCYAPALRGYFAQDDYLLLALARLLRDPLAPFWHDHFPGSAFFRPLGIFAWWLAASLFDAAPRGHYALNFALHAGVVLALYALLQRLRPNALLNAAWCALYAVSPLAIGTALWLSDRFDLLATAFSLLALNAAVGWIERPRAGTLALMLAFLLLAFGAKEIAIVAALAIAALLVLSNGAAVAARRRWSAALAVLALTAAWLAYRHALLTNPQDLWLRSQAIAAVFFDGSVRWCRIGFELLVLDPRQHAATRVVAAIGAAALLVALGRSARGGGWKNPRCGVAAALALLILLPGPIQAPVVAVTGDLAAGGDWLDLVAKSRLFHLSFAGLVAALALLTTPAAARRAAATSTWTAAALCALLVAWLPASHSLARDYARQTRALAPPLQAANAAIAKLELPAQGRCQVYLLGAAAVRGFADSADAMIKATFPQIDRIAHCLILGERAPWANLLRAGSLADPAPLRALVFRGSPVPWIVVDGVEIAYLDLDADVDARALDDAFFLDYRDGTFVDVGADVRSGARPVKFFNARPQH